MNAKVAIVFDVEGAKKSEPCHKWKKKVFELQKGIVYKGIVALELLEKNKTLWNEIKELKLEVVSPVLLITENYLNFLRKGWDDCLETRFTGHFLLKSDWEIECPITLRLISHEQGTVYRECATLIIF